MAVVVILLVLLVVVAMVVAAALASLSWYSAQNQRQDNARVNLTAESAPEGGIAGGRTTSLK